MKQIKRTASVHGQTKASDRWRTPSPVFAALDAEFHFDIDLAADATNHLCPRWLGPGGLAEDALTVRWADFGSVGFLNMPYSAALIFRFMAAVAQHRHDMTIVALHPHDTSTAWWDFTRYAVEIRELETRVPYLREDGVTKAGAMFASAVTVFRPQPGLLRALPRRVLWTWLTPEERKRRQVRRDRKVARVLGEA